MRCPVLLQNACIRGENIAAATDAHLLTSDQSTLLGSHHDQNGPMNSRREQQKDHFTPMYVTLGATY